MTQETPIMPMGLSLSDMSIANIRSVSPLHHHYGGGVCCSGGEEHEAGLSDRWDMGCQRMSFEASDHDNSM